jgi:hypothetical protein
LGKTGHFRQRTGKKEDMGSKAQARAAETGSGVPSDCSIIEQHNTCKS